MEAGICKWFIHLLTMADVFFSIGSNVGDRSNNLKEAVKQLSEKVGQVKAKSQVYESEPWGYKDQNQYLNQVIYVSSDLMPDVILKEALLIEKSLGRERSGWQGYESRTMDIDLLIYDDMEISTVELTVPHPKMHLRNFVLVPFSEIAPNVIHPVFRQKIEKLKEDCNDKSRVSILANS